MPANNDYLDIVQITDCHLFADKDSGLYGLNSFHCLTEIVDHVRQRPVDLVLATGDLVHDETPEGYQVLRDALAALECPVYVLAGNHDAPELIHEMLNGDGFSSAKSVCFERWQIVLLDSHVPGAVGGRLSDSELRYLTQALAAHEDKHALICVHHQPVPVGSAWLDGLGLHNGAQLMERIGASPHVKAVVWGHVHQVYDAAWAGVRLLATPSTCIQFKPDCDDFALDPLPPGYRTLRLHADGRIDTQVHRLATLPGELNAAAKGY